MLKWFGIALLIFAATIQAAFAGSAVESWVEARSPHFVVVSDASASQARDVAARFEQVRAVFQKAFPGMRVYPDLPIVILATRDRASFQALSPPDWSKQGELSRSGMMLRNLDKNFIFLLLDAPDENPYHVVYHEYAHLVLEDDFRNIPLWLNEGLAEFYGNSDIDHKTVRLGLPSKGNLDILRERPWLPLATLFTVDQTSPYYNEEDKGTIFYAESWALTDFLMFVKASGGKGPIDRYLALVAHSSNTDWNPVTAAVEAFGNLDELEVNLQSYVKRSAFRYYRLNVAPPESPDSYPVKTLSPAESEAIRGDFMARTGNVDAAKSLLLDALRQDPKLTSIDQSMGLVELHQKHDAAAASWFAKAAADCPSCVYSRFYNAVALMQRDSLSDADRQTIASGLEDFIHFNPTFAPAYAILARFEATIDKNPNGALKAADQASEIDPRNLAYLFLHAELMLKAGDDAGALRVAHQAVAVARTPAEKSRAYLFLGAVQQKMEEGAGKP